MKFFHYATLSPSWPSNFCPTRTYLSLSGQLSQRITNFYVSWIITSIVTTQPQLNITKMLGVTWELPKNHPTHPHLPPHSHHKLKLHERRKIVILWKHFWTPPKPIKWPNRAQNGSKWPRKGKKYMVKNKNFKNLKLLVYMSKPQKLFSD